MTEGPEFPARPELRPQVESLDVVGPVEGPVSVADGILK